MLYQNENANKKEAPNPENSRWFTWNLLLWILPWYLMQTMAKQFQCNRLECFRLAGSEGALKCRWKILPTQNKFGIQLVNIFFYFEFLSSYCIYLFGIYVYWACKAILPLFKYSTNVTRNLEKAKKNKKRSIKAVKNTSELYLELFFWKTQRS